MKLPFYLLSSVLIATLLFGAIAGMAVPEAKPSSCTVGAGETARDW